MSVLLPKQCILVVDDSPENIDLLSEVLRDDYRIRIATSGEKALKIVYSDEPPDLGESDRMRCGRYHKKQASERNAIERACDRFGCRLGQAVKCLGKVHQVT